MNIPSSFYRLEGFRLPPEFWPAFGYDVDTAPRFVSIYWTPFGDEAEVDDGRFAGTMNWSAYLVLVNHEHNLHLTSQFNFGNSDEEAEYRLLIDLEENKVYAGPDIEVAQFVVDQWGEPGGEGWIDEPVLLSEEGWLKLQEEVSRAFQFSATPEPREIALQLEQNRQNVAALQEAMNRD